MRDTFKPKGQTLAESLAESLKAYAQSDLEPSDQVVSKYGKRFDIPIAMSKTTHSADEIIGMSVLFYGYPDFTDFEQKLFDAIQPMVEQANERFNGDLEQQYDSIFDSGELADNEWWFRKNMPEFNTFDACYWATLEAAQAIATK